MRERTSKEYISIPHIERPAIKLHIKHVETLRKRHRVTYAAAHEALGSMDTRVPQHGERRNEKLHVVVAVKLKGVSQVYIAENNTRHHAERELAQILIQLKRTYDAQRAPFPRIQSLCLVARHPHEMDTQKDLPQILQVDTLPEGTPCMCEKCIRLFRRLLKYLYPEPRRATEDSEALFAKRQERWRKTRNFQMIIGIGDTKQGLVLRTNFNTTPIVPFPGSQAAKSVHELLEED